MPAAVAVGAAVLAVVASVVLLGGTGAGAGEEVVPAVAVSAAAPGDLTSVVTREDRAVPAPGGAGEGAHRAPSEAASAPGPGVAAGVAPPEPGTLVVHVDGAVTHPGVVSVPAGSRVSDAVQAAGGVTSQADTRMVNLARLLTDGELVVVPVPGEAVPAAAAGGAGGGAPGGAGPPAAPGASPAPAAPLDLNAADATALDALPGIGPVLAQRIVAHREDVGPFTSVDDLDAVSGIGPSVMESLRDLVTV